MKEKLGDGEVDDNSKHPEHEVASEACPGRTMNTWIVFSHHKQQSCFKDLIQKYG